MEILKATIPNTGDAENISGSIYQTETLKAEMKNVSPSKGAGLPPVTEEDDGRILGVTGGKWGAIPVYLGKGAFEGPYEVVPNVGEQIIDTDQKVMEQNLIIKPIPVHRVSNTAGGSTVYIGSEV